MEKRNSFLNSVSYIILILYMLLILYYAVIPLNLPKLIEFDSRRLLWHFLEYVVLSFLLLNATRNFRTSLILSIFYGSTLELIQLWAPTRVFDFLDLGANILGAVIGTLSFSKLFKIHNKK